MSKSVSRQRNDLFSYSLTRFLFRNAAFIRMIQLVAAGLFAYAVIFGIVYPLKEENLFTPAVLWTLFWPLFILLTLPILGRVFCGICPHALLGKYLTRIGLQKKPPRLLRNPAAGLSLLIAGLWGSYYALTPLYSVPVFLSLCFLVLTLAAAVFFYLFDGMTYCKAICPIGAPMRVFSRISFTWLDSYETCCKECRTFACAKACAYQLKPFTFNRKNTMEDCTLCMDCARQCDAIRFSLKPPSFSLWQTFRVSRPEVWAMLLVTAAVMFTMMLYHSLGRVAISDTYPWVILGRKMQELTGYAGIDYVGVAAFLCSLLMTIVIAATGMALAAACLRRRFGEVFYTLSYAYLPIFIVGVLGHTYSSFFLHGYSTVVNGFIDGFGLALAHVEPLATRQDAWLQSFAVLNYLAAGWAFFLLARLLKRFAAGKVMKTCAFLCASSLILFYLGLNGYKIYAFKTYGMKKYPRPAAVASRDGAESIREGNASAIASGQLPRPTD